MSTRALWLTKGLGRGGAERLIATCAPLLNRNGFDIEVAYLTPHKDAFVEELVAHGLTVHCLRASHDVETQWPRRLRQLLRAGDFDLLHTHSPMSAAVARRIAPSSMRIIHTEHSVWTRYRRPTYWANALTYHRNDAVIAVSQAVARSVPKAWLPRKIRNEGIDVVLHGIDLTPPSSPKSHRGRAKARAALGLSSDVLVVGTVGNMKAAKDHVMLLDAFSRVHARRPDARLFMVGGGPLEERLRRRVSELGLNGVVELLGVREDARELMQAFDVFALSSRFEGFSIALLEALSAGVPAVATRVGGTPEILEGSGAGLVVPRGDPVAFSQALSSVLDDEALRRQMAAAARRRAATLDVRHSAEEIEGIYDRVMAS